MKQPTIRNMRLNRSATDEIRRRALKVSKVRITINLDSDVLGSLRAIAEQKGIPYQTYINRILRELGSKRSVEDADRLEKLEKQVAAIKKKLAA